jgi:hypothetical protein
MYSLHNISPVPIIYHYTKSADNHPISKSISIPSKINFAVSSFKNIKFKYDANNTLYKYQNYEEIQINKKVTLELLYIFYCDSLAVLYLIWFFHYR